MMRRAPAQRRRGFRIFGTTADVGVRARGPTRAQLFEQAARGLFSIIGETPRLGAGQRLRRLTVRVNAPNLDLLLHAWLAELLFLFDARSIFAVAYAGTHVGGGEIRSTVLYVDAAHAALRRQVKAVTLHRLHVRRTTRGWSAAVILDV